MRHKDLPNFFFVICLSVMIHLGRRVDEAAKFFVALVIAKKKNQQECIENSARHNKDEVLTVLKSLTQPWRSGMLEPGRKPHQLGLVQVVPHP